MRLWRSDANVEPILYGGIGRLSGGVVSCPVTPPEQHPLAKDEAFRSLTRNSFAATSLARFLPSIALAAQVKSEK